MQNNVRLAIEVSQYIRRIIGELFEEGAGFNIGNTAFLIVDEDHGMGAGIIDELDRDTDEFKWANAVLMLFRTLYGILENAEEELNGEI